MVCLDQAAGILSERTRTPQFVLEPEEAQQAVAGTSNGLQQGDAALLALVHFAVPMAVAGISGFHVGAVARGESGRIYVGVNVELPGLPLNASIHAEQCLVTNLLLHQEQSAVAIAVSAAPCGHCRQFLSELICAETMTLHFGEGMHPHRLPQILPERFGPHSLLAAGQQPLLLLQPQFHDIHLVSDIPRLAELPQHLIDGAAQKALHAATAAYTPYYRCPAAAAIIFCHDPVSADSQYDIVAGPCIESAAHNPGMLPLQSAIVAGILTGRMRRFDQIVAALVLECKDMCIQYAATSQITLASIAPKACYISMHIQYNQDQTAPKLATS